MALVAASAVAWWPSATDPASRTPTALVTGRQVFLAKGCAACHTHPAVDTDQEFRAGPDLGGLAETAATRVAGLSGEAYVRDSIRTPQAVLAPGYTDRMGPGSRMPILAVSERELDALVDFLLRDSEPTGS